MSEKDEQQPKGETQFEGKMPDFIYIDDVRGYEKRQGAQKERMDYFENIQKIGKDGYPFFLRIVTLVAGIVLLSWAVFVSLFLIVVTVLAALCLFKVDPLNDYVTSLWKILSRMSAFCLSLFVATITPGFGFGILALYLMMNGENLETSFMARILKKSRTI